MPKLIYVTISDDQGCVLDRFPVTHWRDDTARPEDDGDGESYGSHASNSLLAERIERAAENQ